MGRGRWRGEIEIASIFPPNCGLCYAKRTGAVCGRTIVHLWRGGRVTSAYLGIGPPRFLQCPLRRRLEYFIGRAAHPARERGARCLLITSAVAQRQRRRGSTPRQIEFRSGSIQRDHCAFEKLLCLYLSANGRN
ncbi:hypothetical protein EVAR_23494_1 [Eumeta japonica]|uniref:Uncharacterized protein n=1 Tax=Eumeta variegata TaxID=151549 RepID=A0A4C1W1T5_EUMVA|nr:hypothetical protein EVAR_23494_1 [Eumeta japonica]